MYWFASTFVRQILIVFENFIQTKSDYTNCTKTNHKTLLSWYKNRLIFVHIAQIHTDKRSILFGIIFKQNVVYITFRITTHNILFIFLLRSYKGSNNTINLKHKLFKFINCPCFTLITSRVPF